MTASSNWLVRWNSIDAPVTLYCFSHAGGHASDYRTWQQFLGPMVSVRAVQLPGHGSRRHEPLMTVFDDVVDCIIAAIATDVRPDRPVAFFGHSLGALLAFETSRRLFADGDRGPDHLLLSGSAGPRRRPLSRGVHRLSEADLIKELGRLAGTPSEALENAELMRLVLPVVRADFALVDGFTYQPGAPFSIPMTLFAGSSDPDARPDQVNDWAMETVADCRLHIVEGDHFFIHSNLATVLSEVSTVCQQLVLARSRVAVGL